MHRRTIVTAVGHRDLTIPKNAVSGEENGPLNSDVQPFAHAHLCGYAISAHFVVRRLRRWSQMNGAA